MPDRRRLLLYGGIGAAAVAGGAGVAILLRDDRPAAMAELRAIEFPDLSGKPQRLDNWRGKVLLVNFWGTWCEPCREEVPALVSTHQKWRAKGVEIVGIGIDSATKMQQFASEYKISYPLVVAGPEVVQITRRLGNKAGGLPYTLFLDRAGRLAHSHLGAMTQDAMDAALGPLASA